MKLTKKETLEIYYLLRRDNYGSDDEEVEGLLQKLQEHLTSESESDDDAFEDEDNDSSEEEEEEEEEEGEEEEEATDDPEFDDVIDAADLAELSQCSSSVEGQSQRIKFQCNDDDGCDLVAGKQEKISNVQYVQRTTKTLSVWSDGWWHDFDVKRFPKEWTVLLEVDLIYKLD